MTKTLARSAGDATTARPSSGPGLLALGHAGWITFALGILLALLVVPPILLLVIGSLHTTTATGAFGEFTFAYYRELATNPRLWTSLANSLAFAAGSATLALVLGAAVAWIVERTRAPFKVLAYLSAIISLGTPYVLYVSAWLFLFSKVGPFNQLYRLVSGADDSLFYPHSLWGMIMVEGFLWSPLVFLMLSSTFRASNPEFEEAARVSGASVWGTIRRVSLRLAMPAMLALALLVFIRALEGFEVPSLVGGPGRVSVLTTDIYTSLRQRVPADVGGASSFSVVLLVLVSVLLTFYGRISRKAEQFHTVTGKGFRARPFDLGEAGRWLAGGVIILYFVFLLLLPLLVLLWASLLPFFQPISAAGFGRLTLANYKAVLERTYYLELIVNTLFVSAAAATLVMAITLVVGWQVARRRRLAWILDQLATIPLIFPGIVLGAAMLQIWAVVPLPIYGTIWIILFAYLIRYLPYGMRYSHAGMLQIHPELEEAAAVSGAGSFGTLRRILLPLLTPSMVAGWLFIFLLGTRVLSLPILLAGPKSQMIATTMFDLWSNGQGTEMATVGLLWTAMMTVLAGAFYFISQRAGGAYD